MQAELQISLHEIGPPFNSSGDAMIHRLCRVNVLCGFARINSSSTRLCTDHSIRERFSDKLLQPVMLSGAKHLQLFFGLSKMIRDSSLRSE